MGGTPQANQAAILFGLVIGSLTEPSGGRIKTHLSNLKKQNKARPRIDYVRSTSSPCKNLLLDRKGYILLVRLDGSIDCRPTTDALGYLTLNILAIT